MNHNSPNVNKDKHANILPLLHRDEIYKQVIWYRLRITVQWMKSVGCER